MYMYILKEITARPLVTIQSYMIKAIKKILQIPTIFFKPSCKIKRVGINIICNMHAIYMHRYYSVNFCMYSYCTYWFSGGMAVDNTDFGLATGPIFVSNVSCYGNESSLTECDFTTDIPAVCNNHTRDAAVSCQPGFGTS